MSIKGTPPTLEWIGIESLSVDPAYQRAVDGSKSRSIIFGMVKEWDWSLCQPLVVSRRTDGGLFILDGQHRHAGAKQRGDIPHLPCVVLTGRDEQHEAAAFVALNTKRQKLSQNDIFLGMLAAGDEHAQATAAILEQTGWKSARHTNTASFKPGELMCGPMLAKSIKQAGEAPVRNALTALREAYPDQPVRIAGTMLRALIVIYRDDLLKGVDCDDFIETLGSVEPQSWIEAGQDMARDNPAYSRIESIVEAMLDAMPDERLAA